MVRRDPKHTNSGALDRGVDFTNSRAVTGIVRNSNRGVDLATRHPPQRAQDRDTDVGANLAARELKAEAARPVVRTRLAFGLDQQSTPGLDDYEIIAVLSGCDPTLDSPTAVDEEV